MSRYLVSLVICFFINLSLPHASAGENSQLPQQSILIMGDSISAGFGIDGNFLFFWANPFGNYNMYKYDVINGLFVDSFSATASAVSAYYAKSSNKYIYANTWSSSALAKTTGFNSAVSPLSTNSLSGIKTISFNASSGTVYAFSDNSGLLYAGADGGSFSTLFDFDPVRQNLYINNVCYYKNDQFIATVNGQIITCKIAPDFQDIKSYTDLGNVDVLSLSTNGTDIWVYVMDYNTYLYEYRKITLKD